MKRILMNIALLSTGLLILSCNQSPLFYSISKETPPKDPIVAGQPSKIVPSDVSGSTKLYAANGKLWVYDGTQWTKLAAQPSGNVRDVAATTGAGKALYALTVDGSSSLSTTLYKSTDGTNWTAVTNSTGYPVLGGGLYGAGATLFVGARNSAGTAAVLYDNNGSLEAALENISISDTVPGTLAGAVQLSGTYYLAVTGKGVYSSDSQNFSPGSTDTKYKLNGLIALDNQVVAVGGGGYMLVGDSSGFSEVSGAADTAYPYTGALALWTDGTNQLLLAGRRYSTYTNGYWEIALSLGNLPGTVSLQVPGSGSPSTVADKDTYQQSLGQKVLTALYQAPANLGSTLFASTIQDGLWSYRNGAWNAEE